MDKTIQTAGLALAGILILFAVGTALSGTSPAGSEGPVTVYFFYGEECPHCHDVMPLVLSLKEKYPDVDFQILEIWHNTENARLFMKVSRETGTSQSGVPQAIIGDVALVGGRDIPANLEQVIITHRKNTV
jgi:thiol-disulfide isomerase/thioredoxin